ncbi:MAG TPA: hypothetical protein GXX55_05870 [Firmicutes bacterium]|nr:hypothetical protein [Bacillota bacterium]
MEKTRFWLWQLAQRVEAVDRVWVATVPDDHKLRDRIRHRANDEGAWVFWAAREAEGEMLVISSHDLSSSGRRRSEPPLAGEWRTPVGAMILARWALRFPGVRRVNLYGTDRDDNQDEDDWYEPLYEPVGIVAQQDEGGYIQMRAAPELAAAWARERYGVEVLLDEPGGARVPPRFARVWARLLAEALVEVRAEYSELHLE